MYGFPAESHKFPFRSARLPTQRTSGYSAPKKEFIVSFTKGRINVRFVITARFRDNEKQSVQNKPVKLLASR